MHSGPKTAKTLRILVAGDFLSTEKVHPPYDSLHGPRWHPFGSMAHFRFCGRESLPLKYRNPDDGYHRLACFGLDGFGRLSQLYRSELHAMGLAVANTLRAWEDYMSGALALTAASMESFHCTGSGDRAVRLRVFA